MITKTIPEPLNVTLLDAVFICSSTFRPLNFMLGRLCPHIVLSIVMEPNLCQSHVAVLLVLAEGYGECGLMQNRACLL